MVLYSGQVIALLLTPLIIERTGSGALMGSVMSLIGLFGISAPFVGWLADKYRIHRQMQKIALFSHLLSLILLYFAQTNAYVYLLVGLTIGIGTVSQLVLNPTFVLNSLPEKSQAQGLSRLFQCQFLGVVIAGALLGMVSLLGWSSEQKLLMLMVLVCVSIISVFIAPPPAIRIPDTAQQHDDSSINTNKSRRTTIAFVLFLTTVFVSMFTASNLMETGPIIIQQVFNVDLGHSAFGLAGSAILTMLLLEPAGRLAAKSSPYLIWIVSLCCYAVTAIGLWLAMGSDIPSLVPILLIVLLMQAISWFDMVIPAIAEELSPSTPALTQGILMFAMAIGFGVGTYIAGQLIDVGGFTSVVNYCAASIVITLLLALATLMFKTKR